MATLQYLLDVLGAERYSQHAICLTNDPLMLWIYTAADLTIFVSYFTISVLLMMERIRKAPITVNLFAAFIMACGLSHLTKTLTLYTGVYRLDVLVVAGTASISGVTALFVLRGALDERH